MKQEVKREVYWRGTIRTADDFNDPITTEFIDGKTRHGPWAIMTPQSWKRMGVNQLGVGFGQKYKKQPDGRWLKVQG